MSDPDEPQSFQEAWWDPDLISREKWREAIHVEFKKMLDMGVWRHVRRNDHPNDHRLVGCRWVFKVKRNGVYRARLVAKGFSQIPGVDFTDNYSPVTEFRQPLQVQSHLEMPRILVQLGHTQRT